MPDLGGGPSKLLDDVRPRISSLAGAAGETVGRARTAAEDDMTRGAAALAGWLQEAQGTATGAVAEARGVAGQALDAGRQRLGGLEEEAGAEVARAGQAAATAASGVAREATSAVSSLVGSAASSAVDSFSQMGELLEALEERLLAEIERRGGRFAGVF
jgi:hypothetical protein